MDECVFCGKELEKFEKDICNSCYFIMKMKYPITKCLEEQIRCHKRNTKKQK